MGLFDQFPYTNFHELNLDWLIKLIKELENTVNNFVALNTIKYADPIQWDITTQYEANTVVVDPQTGTAYISTKAVPSGVALTNTDYWSVIFTLDILSANKNLTLRDDGSTVLATFTSVAGDWLIWNNILYKVSQNININESYVPGYNIDRYTVELFIKDYIAAVESIIGDLTDLTTSDNSSVVNAINSIVTDLNNIIATIGDLSDLNTSDKSSIVNAINELVTDINNITINSPIITPEMYGAAGDGVTDDTAAVQAAINAGNVILCRNKYKITSTLFITGNKKLYGDCEFHLYLSEAENFFLILGASAMGVTGDTFSGEIEGLNVIVHGGRYNYVIGGVNAHECVIHNCTFDLSTADCHNKVIFFGDNNALATDMGSKSNYLIDNNRFTFNDTVGNTTNQCEPIGLAWRDNITVSNNTSFYSKDDFGFHGCKNVKVLNNVLENNFTTRIFFSNCQNIVVDGNIINEHPDYKTQGIQLDLETGYTSLPPADFVITNNTITYWATNMESYSYGIRVVGWQRGIIANNNLVSFSQYHGRIFLENCEPFDGLDNTRLVQDVVITGNRCSSITHSVNGATADTAIEPIIISGNEIRHAISFNSYFDYSHGNNLYAGAGTITKATNPSRFTSNLVFELADDPTAAYQLMNIEGLQYFDAKNRYHVAGLAATYETPGSALDSSNYLTFDVRVNGTSKGSFDISSNAAFGTFPAFILNNDDDLTVWVKKTGSATLTRVSCKLKITPVNNI